MSHVMTYGGSEFIKMIQESNKMTCIFLYLCWVGGKINQPGQLSLPPGGEDNQGDGQDIRGQLAGGQDKLLHRNWHKEN